MELQFNYLEIALIIDASIVFIVLLIKRNKKDEKQFEQELNKPVEKLKDDRQH